MAENWPAIAADVAAGLREVGYTATLTRTSGGAETPWGADAATVTTYSVTVVDDGIKTQYSRADDGALIARTARVLTIATGTVIPAMGDTITLHGQEHAIVWVMPLAPGGVALLFEVHLAQ